MAIIPEPEFFSWQAVESSSQIQRLAHVLETLNDEPLMRRLEARRKGRRDDNPVRAMWNSVIAGLVFGKPSVEALRGELARNAELRQVCGFRSGRRTIRVNGQEVETSEAPSEHAYYRFFKSLLEESEMLDAIFADLLERLAQLLPDLGTRLVTDGKAIPAAWKSDPDAAVGVKRQGHPDGDAMGEITCKWFGYKLHMLADATYELPVAFKVTNAAEHESPHLMDLIETAREKSPEVLERAETLAGDKGYDDGKDKAAIYNDYDIKPLIPARDLNKGEMQPLDPQRHDTIYYSPTGEVACKVAPFETETDKQFAAMAYWGFEKKRRALKFRCPAIAFGIECHNRAACRASFKTNRGKYGRVVRVSIDSKPRLFGPIYAHSQQFEDLYKQRTAVERLFSRFDHMYGFEHHHAIGLERMRLQVTLALIVMQATAVGWIEAGQAHNMRRRLRPAA